MRSSTAKTEPDAPEMPITVRMEFKLGLPAWRAPPDRSLTRLRCRAIDRRLRKGARPGDPVRSTVMATFDHAIRSAYVTPAKAGVAL